MATPLSDHACSIALMIASTLVLTRPRIAHSSAALSHGDHCSGREAAAELDVRR